MGLLDLTILVLLLVLSVIILLELPSGLVVHLLLEILQLLGLL